MKDITALQAMPRLQCGEDEQHCPLLRICPSCGYRFVTARGRRQHGNSCSGDLDTELVAAQHDHLIHVHRIRKRRSTR